MEKLSVTSVMDGYSIPVEAFTSREWQVVESINKKLTEDGDSASVIREIGNDIQMVMMEQRSKLLETCRTFKAGEVGKTLNEVVTATHEITSGLKSSSLLGGLMRRLKLEKGKSSKIITQLTNLEDNSAKITEELLSSLDLMQGTADSIQQNARSLTAVVYALQQSAIADEQKISLISKDSGAQEEDLLLGSSDNRKYLLSTKLYRIRELLSQIVVSKQQVQQCYLIIQSNTQWVEELKHATQSALPVFQICVMQAIGIEAGQKAEKAIKSIRFGLNKALLTTAQQLKDNVETLSQAGTTPIIEEDTIVAAQKLIDETYESISKVHSEALVVNTSAIKRLSELSVIKDLGTEENLNADG